MKFLMSAQRFHTNQSPICKALQEDGHEVKFFVQARGMAEDHTVLVPTPMKLSLVGKLIDRHLKKKYDETTYESMLTERFIPSLWWTYREIKKYKPDVAVIRYRMPYTMVLNLACKLAGVKVRILYNQTGLYTKKNEKLSFKKKLVFSMFPKVRMTTVKIHDVFDLKYRADEFHILPHEYFLPYVHEPNPEAENREYFKDGVLNILDVGKYRPYKNHFVLVNAVKVMKDRGDLSDDIHFTIIGQAGAPEEIKYFEDLQQQARDHGVYDYFTFRTHIPYHEMKKLYLQNDVFILTSKEEQASIAILEAMSNGLAQISTNLNGTAHYITEGSDGFFFETDNPESLADTLKHISDNRDQVPTWGRNALQSIKDNYTYKNYKAALSEVLDKEFGVKL
ncbi:MAG: glycosyltransferase family 4 protein [Clostridia bacterium]|nr:glycosyltransferase family 4 protein [Clostridia bacterium]